jgi:hypothetical protein
MKIELDVTGNLSRNVGFGESWIFLNVPNHLESTLSLKAWGIDLSYSILKQQCSFSDIDVKPQDYIYIAGMANVKITGVLGGEFSVGLYEEDRKTLILLPNGHSLSLKKYWDFDVTENYSTYNLGGILDWPNGDCSLEIAAKGKFTIEFNTEDCISTNEYCLNPEKYSYKV